MTGRAVQESIATAARSRGQFAVGGVNGVSHEVFDTKVSFLEPFSEPFLSNMSNLVAHVWHLIRDAMTTMPEEVTIPNCTTLCNRAPLEHF